MLAATIALVEENGDICVASSSYCKSMDFRSQPGQPLDRDGLSFLAAKVERGSVDYEKIRSQARISLLVLEGNQ